MPGWIVEVEDDDGALLYAANALAASDAEDLVRTTLNIKKNKIVRAILPIEDEALMDLDVKPGNMIGPM